MICFQSIFPRIKHTCNKDSEKQMNIMHSREIDKCLKNSFEFAE